MATLKLKKYPKKPKTSASLSTKENYLAKCRAIDAENSKRKKDVDKSKALDKKISGIGKR